MQIDKPTLLSSATKAGISEHQAEKLWNALNEKNPNSESRFDFSHLLYYFGALIVIVAMGWFVGVTWESFGGLGILSIALAYMLAFITAGSILWNKNGFKVPGGLFITLAVCLIPLAVYGLQKWMGWWITDSPGQYKDFVSWVRGGWFAMEIATVVGGLIALKFYKFPFLTAPIFFALWFMSMDIVPLIFKDSEDYWNNSLYVSIGFGIILLIVAYVMDINIREDFAFWGYLFGVMTFWTGLSLLDSSSELGRFFYFLINLGMVLLSVLLQRCVFLIFGTIGILSYISSLFYRYFSESPWFPVILSMIGILVIGIGLIYHKNRQKIEASILNLLPKNIQAWLPKRL